MDRTSEIRNPNGLFLPYRFTPVLVKADQEVLGKVEHQKGWEDRGVTSTSLREGGSEGLVVVLNQGDCGSSRPRGVETRLPSLEEKRNTEDQKGFRLKDLKFRAILLINTVVMAEFYRP